MKYPNRSQSLPVTPLPRPEMDWEVMKVFSLYRRLEGADDLSPVKRASPVYSSPATYAVGQIPELVDRILGFASKPSLYNCLFVCKAYSNFATKHIWRDLPGAIPLLKLLGPIVTFDRPGQSPSWGFRTPPSQTQWANFHAHAKYVKTISQPSQPSRTWEHGTTDYAWPVEQVLQSYRELVVDSPFGPPCCMPASRPISYHALQTLQAQNWDALYPESESHWTQSISQPLRLTPNLERLTFTFGNDDMAPSPSASFEPFLTPKLTTLNLLFHVCPQKTSRIFGEDLLIGMISDSLDYLAAFSCSLHHHQTPLRDLLRLQICMDSQELVLSPGYCEVNDAILDLLDSCTQLRYLKLPPFLEHGRLLSSIQKFSQLSSLSVSFDAPQEMVSFAQGIASALPNLRKLGLGHRGDAPTPKQQLFKPLLKLSNLVELTIKTYAQAAIIEFENDPPWLLSLPFLQELSTAWPKLESLRLYPSNYVNLLSLESFQDSDLFPSLTHLAIDIDNVIQAVPPPMRAVAAAVRLMRPLRSLRLLDIGTTLDTIYDGLSEPFALITYAEQLGPSGMRVLVNGNLPRGRRDSL
ncbi:hypothetical protein FRC04_003876 [Tulasnella sp. 424]|nr:hypothetical protein FRC04_003876 [Tulasnella sp. 424]KAG8964926.1 hypothetical protein FRC05_003532 [Tulasnella sp. 425]